MTDLRTNDDPYAILGVARGSSDATIVAAHRALARQFHPDIAGEGATARMMRINAAFDAIRTSARRIAFDGLDHWQATPGRDDRDEHGVFPGEARPTSSTTYTTDTAAPLGRRSRPERDGTGGAGPSPGRPSGSVLGFGRHVGWSIGEIARVDPGYLEWLSERREGRPYLDEIAATLRRVGFRQDRGAESTPRERRRGVFRRG
ncbi:MAG: DnaJ domain-containing protein [Candidatus Limnocylindrales bacterium]